MTEFNIGDAEMAARVSCNRSQLNRIKHGRSCPSLDLALRIAKATGNAVTPEELLKFARAAE